MDEKFCIRENDLTTEQALHYSIIPVTPLQQNCSLVVCQATGDAALIDPGGEAERLLEAIAAVQATPRAILLTHGHLDHVAASAELAQHWGIPIIGPHADDAFWLDALPAQCEMFGFPATPALRPDRWLQEGDRIEIGRLVFEVLHCPGHTPGHVVFHLAASRIAWVGDVLFKGSVGRTDFPRGDAHALRASIRGKLWPLGDETLFIPGHGPTSTFGAERRSNPWVADR